MSSKYKNASLSNQCLCMFCGLDENQMGKMIQPINKKDSLHLKAKIWLKTLRSGLCLCWRVELWVVCFCDFAIVEQGQIKTWYIIAKLCNTMSAQCKPQENFDGMRKNSLQKHTVHRQSSHSRENVKDKTVATTMFLHKYTSALTLAGSSPKTQSCSAMYFSSGLSFHLWGAV